VKMMTAASTCSGGRLPFIDYAGIGELKREVVNDNLLVMGVDQCWVEKSSSNIVWSYFGSANGLYRMTPAATSKKGYDPTKRPWYMGAVANVKSSGGFDVTMTMPYVRTPPQPGERHSNRASPTPTERAPAQPSRQWGGFGCLPPTARDSARFCCRRAAVFTLWGVRALYSAASEVRLQLVGAVGGRFPACKPLRTRPPDWRSFAHGRAKLTLLLRSQVPGRRRSGGDRVRLQDRHDAGWNRRAGGRGRQRRHEAVRGQGCRGEGRRLRRELDHVHDHRRDGAHRVRASEASAK
jgi:hypothetical protein